VSSFALAAVLGGAILAASMISVEVGLSVALIELAGGVFVGNVFHPQLPDWLSFIGSFAGIVLTFLAGAEVDVPQFKREWRASVSIGAVSFFAPFFVAGAVAYWALGWTFKQSEIAGIALSTTSLAVVYAVLVETGLNQDLVGTPHVRDVRDGLRHRRGALDPLHQAEHLDRSLRPRLRRAHRRAAANRSLVLSPLRRPRDRA
jgi:Kef-type K+ transport system membrane component KefB